MFKETILLSEEEMALILAKREEDKANGLLRQKAYEEQKDKAYKSAQKRLHDRVAVNVKEVEAYEDYFNKIIAINPNFKLERTNLEFSEEVKSNKLDYIDEEGKNIWQYANGDLIPSSEYCEVHEILTAPNIQCKIVFTGDLPNDNSYSVEVVEHKTLSTKHTFSRKRGYKMRVKGTNFDFNEERRYLSSPKTVVDKILERADWDFKMIEAKNARETLKSRALKEAKEIYLNSEVVVDEYKERLIVQLENGIKVYVSYSETDGMISFRTSEVHGIAYKEADPIIGALSKIKFG